MKAQVLIEGYALELSRFQRKTGIVNKNVKTQVDNNPDQKSLFRSTVEVQCSKDSRDGKILEQ